MIKDLTLILGNQLFNPSLLAPVSKYPVFMCESDDLCTHFKYHQLKITFFFCAMREYRDELEKHGTTCFYHDCPLDKIQLFFDCLGRFCKEHQVERIHFFEIEVCIF